MEDSQETFMSRETKSSSSEIYVYPPELLSTLRLSNPEPNPLQHILRHRRT
jgi:hypothetical protein